MSAPPTNSLLAASANLARARAALVDAGEYNLEERLRLIQFAVRHRLEREDGAAVTFAPGIEVPQ